MPVEVKLFWEFEQEVIVEVGMYTVLCAYFSLVEMSDGY